MFVLSLAEQMNPETSFVSLNYSIDKNARDWKIMEDFNVGGVAVD